MPPGQTAALPIGFETSFCLASRPLIAHAVNGLDVGRAAVGFNLAANPADGSAISPGPWSRQRPSRCAFRAGRNLPDKEFRYLMTYLKCLLPYAQMLIAYCQTLKSERILHIKYRYNQ